METAMVKPSVTMQPKQVPLSHHMNKDRNVVSKWELIS